MGSLNDLKNAGIYNGIENRVCELCTSLSSEIKLTGRFFYLKFRNKCITEKEFAKFTYDKIMRYCIPRKKLSDAFRKFRETNEERYINDLQDQARNLFVKSIEKHGAHLGEPGELILFILLEAFFNAPQIACKMYLKTSEKMAVHGSDSVHIKMDENSENLTLIWGESKLYSILSKAFDEALKSIKSFVSIDSDSGRAPKERDIDIIKDMPDVDNDEMKHELYDYFDPYSEKSNKWSEEFFCMIGFDYDLYKKLPNMKDDELEIFFASRYMSKIEKAFKNFEEKILQENLEHLEFKLILLPFESVENFRKEFYNLLGVNIKCQEGKK